MAQRLNKRLVVILTIAGMALTTAAGVLMIKLLVKPIETDPGRVAEQADTLIKNGMYEQAMILYQRASARSRRSGQPAAVYNNYLILAGDMAYQAGKVAPAREFWRQVLRDEPGNMVAQEKMVDILLGFYRLTGRMDVRDWEAVEDEARRLCEISGYKSPLGLSACGLAMERRRALGIGSAPRAAGTAPPELKSGIDYLVRGFELSGADPELADHLAQTYLEQAKQLLEGRIQQAGTTPDQLLQMAEDVYKKLTDALAGQPSKDPKAAAKAWRYAGNFQLQRIQLAVARQARLQREGARTNDPAFERLKQQVSDADGKARLAMEKAVALGGEDAESLVGLGDYWATRLEMDEQARQETSEAFTQAKQSYERAKRAAPDEFESYLKLSSLYRLVNNAEEAACQLEERLSLPIRLGTYRESRDKIYTAHLRVQAFRTRMTQAQRLDPKSPDYKQELARLTGPKTPPPPPPKSQSTQPTRGPTPGMNGLMRSYINEAGTADDAIALYMLGRMATLEGRTSEAVLKFEEAVRKSADMPEELATEMQLYLANHYLATQQTGKAHDVFKLLISGRGIPDSDAAWSLYALVLAAVGDSEEKIELAAQRAYQLNPKNIQALRLLERIYEQRGSLERLKVVRQALGRSGEAIAKVSEAVVALRESNNQKAADALREALKTEPGHLEAVQYLVSILAPTASTPAEEKATRMAEIRKVIAAAVADCQARLAQAPSTAPAEAETDYAGQITRLRLLEISADPELDKNAKWARMESVIREMSNPADRAVSLAQLYAQSERPDDALAQWKEAHRLEPKSSKVLEALFRGALQKGDWALAEECSGKFSALELAAAQEKQVEPETWPARLRVGRISLAKAQADVEAKKPDSAKEHAKNAQRELEAAIKLYPSFADSHVWLAQAYGVLEQYDQAQLAFNQALALNPRNAEALFGMLMIAKIKGDDAQWREWLTQLRKVLPNHEVVQRYAIDLDENDPSADLAKSIQTREEKQRSDPKDVDNLLKLAMLHRRAAEKTNDDAARKAAVDKARQAYEGARGLQPDHRTLVEVVMAYADFLRKTTPPDPAQAEKMLQQVIQQAEGPQHKATFQLVLAGHLESWQNLDANDRPAGPAVDAAYDAAALLSQAPEVLVDIGQYYLRTERRKKAEEWFRKAVDASNQQSPDMNRQARMLLIQAIFEPGDSSRHAELEKEIKAYGEKFQDGFDLLARCDLALASGRYADAREAMNQYVNRLPQDPIGYYRRGQIWYMQRGDQGTSGGKKAIEQATEDLRKAKMLKAKLREPFRFRHRILLALCMAEIGQPDLAVAELNGVITESLSDKDGVSAGEAMMQLYQLCASLKRWGEVERLVAPYSSQYPENPSWPSLLSSLYAAQYRDALAQSGGTGEPSTAARESLTKAIRYAAEAAERSLRLDRRQFSPEFIEKLAQLCISGKRAEDWVQFVESKLSAEYRKLPWVLMKLGEAHASRKDTARSAEAYGRALDEVSAMTGQDYSPLPDARNLVTSMTIHLDKAAAKSLLEKRLAAKPQDRVNLFAVAVFNLNTGGGDAGRKALEELLAQTAGTDLKARREQALMLWETAVSLHRDKQYEAAKKAYDALLAISPGDPQALNNAAVLLMTELKDPEGALSYSERAVKALRKDAGPEEKAAVLDTLGWNLVLAKKLDTGIYWLRQATDACPNPSDAFRYTLAGIHYHAAEAHVRRAEASSSGSDEDRKEAVRHLREAAGLLARSGPEDPDGFRRDVESLAAKLKVELASSPAS